jgi:uncharacterized protein (TIGR00251 family)
VRLKLRVTPKSRADEIVGLTEEGVLRIRVTAAPQDGEANRAVLRLLSRALGVPGAAVRLKGGAASRDKWVEVDGMDAAEAKRRLRGETT